MILLGHFRLERLCVPVPMLGLKGGVRITVLGGERRQLPWSSSFTLDQLN